MIPQEEQIAAKIMQKYPSAKFYGSSGVSIPMGILYCSDTPNKNAGLRIIIRPPMLSEDIRNSEIPYFSLSMKEARMQQMPG